MSLQPSVVEYFNSRKRPAEDIKKTLSSQKVLVLDSATEAKNLLTQIESKSNSFVKKIVYARPSTDVSKISNADKRVKSVSKDKSCSVKKGKKNSTNDKLGSKQADIRKSLFKVCNKKSQDTNSGSAEKKTNKDETSFQPKKEPEQSFEQLAVDESLVPFHLKGCLSPSKSKKQEPDNSTNQEDCEKASESSQVASTSSEASNSQERKELNLGNIKKMLSRSSRLEEMKAALKRFNDNKAKLEELKAKNAQSNGPALERFENVDLQEPLSPMKTPKKGLQLSSPQGKLTPCSLFATPPRVEPASPLKSPMKSPAFQRYQALITEGRPALVLPFKYRALAELFRCIDTVVSMMHNRKETITLSSLKPGVQEISRKNLTEYHLGQIKTVFPSAFDFTMEKVRSLGAHDKYDLVITPLLSDYSKVEDQLDNKHIMMSPSVLLARRRTLFTTLLELTKDHHEEFLMSLTPPMRIPRSRLTRWHPEFAVDDVPDIISAALPQPPNVEKISTAKDVLERARSLFIVNPRMERALQRVSENCSTPTLTAPAPTTTTPTIGGTKSALHGVPASLLEKVRAKQAARALEAMTRTPAEAKEAVRLTRLPEIARILRNLFVAEKKSVLTRDLVLRKLSDSYRESLQQSELDDHLKLLAEKTPGWVTFCNIRKTDYVKLSRNADMSRIMARLEQLAEEKCV